MMKGNVERFEISELALYRFDGRHGFGSPVASYTCSGFDLACGLGFAAIEYVT
jgi:hypothetical protein